MAVKFNSSGGGSVLLDAPSTASNLTVTLPSASGTLVSTGSPFSGGTANGVVYLNGSSVPTTGSALTFDGTSYLDVTSASPYIRAKNVAGTVYSYMAMDGLYSYGGNLITYAPSSYSHLFYVNAAEQMRLTSTGLGIGTSSPSYKLEIKGGNGNQLVLDNAGETYTQQYFKNNGSNQAAIWASTSEFSLYTYSTQPIKFLTNTTERMRINAGAPILCLAGGNTSATGTGIAFPATQSASSDANTLDDYEEGTFTPGINRDGSAVTISYNYRSGFYTKIGRMVHAVISIDVSSMSGGAGSYYIVNLPFASNSDVTYRSTGSLGNYTLFTNLTGSVIFDSATQLYVTNNGAYVSSASASGVIRASITYEV